MLHLDLPVLALRDELVDVLHGGFGNLGHGLQHPLQLAGGEDRTEVPAQLSPGLAAGGVKCGVLLVVLLYVLVLQVIFLVINVSSSTAFSTLLDYWYIF